MNSSELKQQLYMQNNNGINMKKIYISSLLSLMSLGAFAQSAYDAVNIMQSDLNGSARYVGMGGALNALGADISLMSSNPAGTGLYRRSDVNFSLSGLVTGDPGQMHNDRSRMSFDQAGVLFAVKVGGGSSVQYVNFGVNYKKNRNFFGNNAVNVLHLNNQFSQTSQIADIANASLDFVDPDKEWPNVLADIATPNNDPKDYHDGVLGYDEASDSYYGIPAKEAQYSRTTYGSNIEADINISMNVSDRFYYGVSLGIYNFDYSRESFYKEYGIDGFDYDLTNWYRTIGSGVDAKFGFICRPIEDSPFRFGITVQTPTAYKLVDANGSKLYMNNSYVKEGDSGDYEYKFNTPWKFNLSLGHVIGTKLALGAEYEYTNLAAGKFKPSMHMEDADYFDEINSCCIKEYLKGQHTLKLGAEYNPTSSLSLRVGYNFVSSPIDKSSFKDIMYYEPFTDTDYTNWNALNRVTCGVGYKWKHGYVDVAYQYQTQKGDFYAFDHVELIPTSIANNRSQIMATIGFRF